MWPWKHWYGNAALITKEYLVQIRKRYKNVPGTFLYKIGKESIIMDTMVMHELVGYLVTALVLIAVIPVFGMVMEKIIEILYRLCSEIIGQRLTFFIFNRLTFIGVMHHELSHALLAAITGAKITHISLFKPEGRRLGQVEYIPRGMFIFQAVQRTMSAMAPVFCGAITSGAVYFVVKKYAVEMTWWQLAIAIYLLVSIILHMTMSREDLQVMWKGMPVVYLVILVIIYLTKFNLFSGSQTLNSFSMLLGSLSI